MNRLALNAKTAVKPRVNIAAPTLLLGAASDADAPSEMNIPANTAEDRSLLNFFILIQLV